MKRLFLQTLLLAILCVGDASSATADETTIPLAGTWRFRLNAEDVGVAEQWFVQPFEDTVQLPGTTDENQKGIKKDEQCIDRLSRVWYWNGIVSFPKNSVRQLYPPTGHASNWVTTDKMATKKPRTPRESGCFTGARGPVAANHRGKPISTIMRHACNDGAGRGKSPSEP